MGPWAQQVNKVDVTGVGGNTVSEVIFRIFNNRYGRTQTNQNRCHWSKVLEDPDKDLGINFSVAEL